MSTGESGKYHFFVIFAAKRFRRVYAALGNIQGESLSALRRGRHPAWLPIALATNRHNRTQCAAAQQEPADGIQHLVEVKLRLVEGTTAPGFAREVMQPGTLPKCLLGRNRRGCAGQGALIFPDFEVGDQRVAQAKSNQGDAGHEKGIAKQRGEGTHSGYIRATTWGKDGQENGRFQRRTTIPRIPRKHG